MTDKSAIVVDLDHTLIKTDLLWESIVLFLKKHPLKVGSLLSQCLKGKAALKNFLAKNVQMEYSNLPYNQKLLSIISFHKQQSKTLVLASGSNAIHLEAINQHLKIFDYTYGSDSQRNLKGHKKLETIKEKFNKDFYYIGDSINDLPLWNFCEEGIACNPGFLLKNKIQKNITIVSEEASKIKAVLKALRVHQWSKNLLLLLPLMLSHQYTNLDLVFRCLQGILAFSMCSSSVYILNDIFDLESDRSHPTKKRRPIANGSLPIPEALAIFSILLPTSFFIASQLNFMFFSILFFYFFTTTLYSWFFKSIMAVDVVCLAILFTIRIFAGGVATSTPVSNWLLTFSLFFFLGLALLKRYAEFKVESEEGDTTKPAIKGRGYMPEDIHVIQTVGITSSFMSVLVFAIYLNSPAVLNLYSHPKYLWLNSPILIYCLFRFWLLARRGFLTVDPVIYAIKDPISYLLVSMTFLILIMSH